jgi:hypothetical protein
MGMDTQKDNNLTLSHNMAQATTIASGFTGNNTGRLSRFWFQRCERYAEVRQCRGKNGSRTGWENGRMTNLPVRVSFTVRGYADANAEARMVQTEYHQRTQMEDGRK